MINFNQQRKKLTTDAARLIGSLFGNGSVRLFVKFNSGEGGLTGDISFIFGGIDIVRFGG